MSRDLAISIEDKSYRTNGKTVQVLGGCNFQIQAGELFVLLGESGCGKTTLIRLILGLDTEYKGSISSGGAPVKGPGADRAVMFQEPRLLPWMNILKNIEFGNVRKDDNEPSHKRALHMLDLVGLKGCAHHWPRELSGGMAQRAALARALVNLPEVLLLDEPLSALDTHTRARMQDELLSILAKTGTTTMLVTHDIDEAVYLADKVAVMRSKPGRVTAIHTVDIPRPRHRIDERLLKLRAQLLEELLSGNNK